jgi:hypothetical protein
MASLLPIAIAAGGSWEVSRNSPSIVDATSREVEFPEYVPGPHAVVSHFPVSPFIGSWPTHYRMPMCTKWLDPRRTANVEFDPIETPRRSNEHCNSDVSGGGVTNPLARRYPFPGRRYDSRAMALGFGRPIYCYRCRAAEAIPVGTSRHDHCLNSADRVARSGHAQWHSSIACQICSFLSPRWSC